MTYILISTTIKKQQNLIGIGVTFLSSLLNHIPLGKNSPTTLTSKVTKYHSVKFR